MFIVRTNVWLEGMLCTNNAYTVGGGSSVSPERKGTRTHTVSVIALVHGFQSLFASGLHAESFFFFFFQRHP